MAKKQVEIHPSIYRFVCMRDKSTNYHLDFASLNEAIAYTEELNDSKIEWYGVYELRPDKDYLITVLSKRLRPYDDSIPVSKDSPAVKSRKSKSSK